MSHFKKALLVSILCIHSGSILAKEIIPVFIFMGGFNSCGAMDDLYTYPLGMGAASTEKIYEASSFHSKIVAPYFSKTGIEPLTFFTCYSNIVRDMHFDTFQLRYDFEDAKFSGSKSINLHPVDFAGVEFLRPMISAIKMRLNRISEDVIPKVFLLGHSFGGFAAIQLTRALQVEFEIGGLVTIDPISPIECNPWLMLYEPSKVLSGLHTGCSRSPKDVFSVEAIDSILMEGSVDWWVNVYQRQLRQLRSSPIEQFPEDEGSKYLNFQAPRLRPKGRLGFFFTDFHSQLALDFKLWNELYSSRMNLSLDL